jgi:hypothetical protein
MMYKVTTEDMSTGAEVTVFGTLDEMTARYLAEVESFKREGWAKIYAEEVNECIDTMSEWQHDSGEIVFLSLQEVED